MHGRGPFAAWSRSNRPRSGYARGVRFALMFLLGGLAAAAIVFAATGGHVLLLPFLFVLPLGLFGLGRRRDRR